MQHPPDSFKPAPSSTSVMGGGTNIEPIQEDEPYLSTNFSPKQPLVYHQPNLIARLAPIKEDPYEKKLGPGSYDPVKPQMTIVPGVSSFGKSNEKRKLWFEGKSDEKIA